MRFYVVDEAYIAYLKKIDAKVPDNYLGGKAFVGIVFKINGCKYLAPLTSYKIKQDSIRNDAPTCVKLHERGNENNKLGMIQLNNMIPVRDDSISELDITDQTDRYKRMLYKQLEYIKTVKEDINHKAEKLHKLVCVDSHPFFTAFSCDFAALEAASKTYNDKVIAPTET